MDTDQGKIFIGGISWETSEENLKEHFGQYGDVLQTNIMRDKMTNRPRGFGFVLFADPSVVDSVLRDQHNISGRTVDVKRALSKEEQNTSRVASSDGGRNIASGGNVRTKKIFVGGLPPTLTEDSFRQYFENYGHVTDVVIMYDQSTQRPRGFGFISFDSEEAVDRVLHKSFHDLHGKQVEVKRALPKDANPGMSNRLVGGGSSGGNQGYNSSGGNPSSYDGRMDSKGYMQSQNVGGVFGPYGSSGYGAPSYGYGPAGGGMGYGGYGGYGGANPGYAGSAAYGNPNVPNAGYGGGPSGAGRSSWNTQNPSGYSAAGYGNAPWAAAGAGSVSGQSPNGASGYGNQGYGYGNYGGNDGSYGGGYGGRSGSGASGNASSGGGSGGDHYVGGGYGDAGGHSGYGTQSGGSHGVQSGGHSGYGGGYGGPQSRQAQQQ